MDTGRREPESSRCDGLGSHSPELTPEEKFELTLSEAVRQAAINAEQNPPAALVLPGQARACVELNGPLYEYGLLYQRNVASLGLHGQCLDPISEFCWFAVLGRWVAWALLIFQVHT